MLLCAKRFGMESSGRGKVFSAAFLNRSTFNKVPFLGHGVEQRKWNHCIRDTAVRFAVGRDSPPVNRSPFLKRKTLPQDPDSALENL
ncbi:hypothetical protein TNCV_2078281 [Trichonephila clavipes]|nr:hypothetical protein TNCV_2078281 [Trichonephila clavipes]